MYAQGLVWAIRIAGGPNLAQVRERQTQSKRLACAAIICRPREYYVGKSAKLEKNKRLATGIRPSTFEPETRTDHGITYMFIHNIGVAHDCGAERPRGSIYGFAGRLISTDASLHKMHDCTILQEGENFANYVNILSSVYTWNDVMR